ncbi:MAG: Gfo/Idh/MocA family oxidoreductase [Bacteroidia bacterium]|nr:Gfo/Idh/MocA family oxidoreductase [Bacteroidia bacterium]
MTFIASSVPPRVRIGVIGAGHLGKIHLRLLRDLPGCELTGFYDLNEAVRQQVSQALEIPVFSSAEALIAASDAVDIVTPTLSHSLYAHLALDAGKHIFIEKPVTHTLAEAEALAARIHTLGLVGQVGHVERYNPAFLAVRDRELKPMFIEGHRLAPYNPRGTDVPVVLDLMIHDLDIVASLVDSPVASVSASGVAVVSDSPDIANARIVFENGCVANLTASRISLKTMRRLRLFQRNSYVALDFYTKEAEILQLADAPSGPTSLEIQTDTQRKYLTLDKPTPPEVNAIGAELADFVAAIQTGQPVRVPISDGVRALAMAERVLAEISF